MAASFETPTLFTIANDLSRMRVIADVDEADIGSVQDGQRATFTVDAYPDDVFEGTVTQVRLQATTESNVVTYEVVVNAPNPDLKLKPGLTPTSRPTRSRKTACCSFLRKPSVSHPTARPRRCPTLRAAAPKPCGSKRAVESSRSA